MASEFAVVCEHLDVTYGVVKAVDDVSFTVARGEVFGLLGPNGAGKTSVVRALSTIIDPAAGRVFVAGKPLSDATGIRRSIGVLPESNGYPGAITAYEYLTYFGRLYGAGKADASSRARTLLTDVGLEASGDHQIKTFSRGMRQRLGIARALVNRPTVLFLDEPTLGLDPAGREDVLARLSALASQEGASVVYCSHLLDEVERVCDRIAILHRGKIVASGTVGEVTGDSNAARKVFITTAPDDVERAVAVVAGHPDVATAASNKNGDGRIDVQLAGPAGNLNALLGALLEADVGVIAVQQQPRRLSDAFLALTGTHQEDAP